MSNSSNSRKRPSRLGRGLSSLMAAPVETSPAPTESNESAGKESKAVDPPSTNAAPPTNQAKDELHAMASDGLLRLPLDQIRRNPQQPREQFKPGAIASLAASIREQGVMQPIVVRPIPEAERADSAEAVAYEIVAGERRWRAAREAGLELIPALLQDLTDEQCAEWALIENLQREDLNPIEKAQAFKRLASDFGLTQAQIAERMGLERSTITNHLRLLDLSDVVLDLVRQDLLSMGQARAIAGLPDPTQQRKLAERAVREQLSVRKVEDEVRRLLNPATTTPQINTRDNHFSDLDKQLTDQLGTKVKVKPGRKKGTGTLNIEFYSLEQFDTLLKRMQVVTE